LQAGHAVEVVVISDDRITHLARQLD
jgi:hypothetical protein